MAVRGRFGRLPRSAPSLTSTIVALSLEYQRMRDSNIEDAWKSGGLFEGKKVTDDMILKHWRDRRDLLDRADAAWDYYNNRVFQMEFSIEESKMGQGYAEERISDGAMAAFYRKWARKMPTNSEFYRDLMTSAAKFARASAARSSGRSSRSSAEAYANARDNIYSSQEKPFDVVMLVLAQQSSTPGTQIIDAADAMGRDDFGWGTLLGDDPAKFAELLDDIKSDPALAATLTEAVRSYGVDFNGDWSYSNLRSMGKRASSGADRRADLAVKNGRKEDEDHARKAAGKYSDGRISLSLMSDQGGAQSFVEQDEEWQSKLIAAASDPTMSPRAVAKLNADYSTWLTTKGRTLAMRDITPEMLKPGKDFDPDAVTMLNRIESTANAANGNWDGSPTLLDDPLGNLIGGDAQAGQLSGVVFGREGNGAEKVIKDDIAVRQGMAVYVRTNDKGEPDPNGGRIEAIAVQERFAAPPPELDLVPTPGRNGEVIYVQSRPLRVSRVERDQITGQVTREWKPLPFTSPDIGRVVTFTGADGRPVTMYSLRYADPAQGGEIVERWTPTLPIKESFLTGVDPVLGLDKDGASVITITTATPPANLKNKTLPDFDPSAVVAEPSVIFDPSVVDPAATSSPLMSAISASTESTIAYYKAYGRKGIDSAQRAWYSDPQNWTPDMKARLQNAPPEVAGALSWQIIADKVTTEVRLVEGVASGQSDFNPERRAQKVAAAEAWAQQRFEQSPAGQQIADFKQRSERAYLVHQMEQFNLKNRDRTIPGVVPGERHYVPTVPTGEYINRLLNQPGMSNEQAADIVFQWTGGALGKRMEPVTVTEQRRVQPVTGPGAPYGPQPVTYKAVEVTKPYQNPYMPKPKGTQTLTPTGFAIANPPEPASQRVGPRTPITPVVNPNTGFVVKPVETVKPKDDYRKPYVPPGGAPKPM